MKCSILCFVVLHALCTGTNALSSIKPQASVSTQRSTGFLDRRAALQQGIFGGVALIGTAANALDMDAFMNAEIASDTKNCDAKKDPKCKPKLTGDEALCTYGQSGTKARSEACRRVKSSGGQLPSPNTGGKSLGGAYAM